MSSGFTRGFAPVMLAGLFLLLNLPALAQDTFGIYFDEAGTQTSIQTSLPYQQVTAYLILKDPTFSDGLTAWECVVNVRSSGPDPIMTWELAGQALNVVEAPAFLVGMGQPLPSTSDIVLATATILVPQPGQDVGFHIQPFNPPSVQDPPGWGYTVYAPAFGHGPEGALLAGSIASGCESEPVATINGSGYGYSWDLNGIPTDLHFGYLEPGETRELHFNLSNPDYISDRLPVSGQILMVGSGYQYRTNDGYYTTDPTSFRVLPGQELTVDVQLSPEETIIYNGQLVVEVCDETYTVEMVGGYVEGTCAVHPGNHDFGLLPTGGEATYSFRATNLGGGVLTVDPTIDNENFTVTSSPYQQFPITLLRGQSAFAFVTFAPQVAGQFETVLDFGPSACAEVLLAGEASDNIPPECYLSVDEYDFGSVGLGRLESVFIEISNSGGGVMPLDIFLEQEGASFRIRQGEGPVDLGPGDEISVLVDFEPELLGELTAVLHTGSVCSNIPLMGTGREPEEAYWVGPLLEIPTTQVGQMRQYPLQIRNLGETTVTGDLQISGDPAFSLVTPGPFSVPPGAMIHRYVNFNPTEIGPHEAIITTGLPGGETVAVTAFSVVEFPRPNNVLGMHFNESWEGSEAWTQEPDEVVTAYLVLHNPTTTAGVAGWELCINPSQYSWADIISWEIEGSSTTYGAANCPQVFLDSPLPPASDILLATMEILVEQPYQAVFQLRPHPEGAIWDYAAYIDAADGETRIPVAGPDEWYFAIINQSSVDVQIPDPPQVEAQGTNVQLLWACDGQADGYHVYRRLEAEQPIRITDQPVTCLDGLGRWSDDPVATPGVTVYYSTSALINNQETPLSPEVEFTFNGVLPSATRLLPCYPNPFNPETHIDFTLSEAGRVRLSVFDLSGRLVQVLANEGLRSGPHQRVWNGRDQSGRTQPSGVYYFRLQTSQGVFMQKAMLLK